MVDPVNLLVLDEPTNHLDLPSCDVLEEALTAYPGTVLLVTHDRYLIRSVADALVEVRDGAVVYHPGVDEEVLAPSAATLAAGRATAGTTGTQGGSARRPNKAESRRLSAEERQARQRATKELKATVQRLERQIAKLETEAAKLAEQLADPAIYDDHQKVRELADAHEANGAELDRLLTEWTEAQSALERVDA
jgi:ATP-binding cassette subfamily F protein 3